MTWPNRVMAVLFLASAALQWNDPDPARWVAVYLAAAAACLLSGRTRLAGAVAGLTGGAAILWASLLYPEVWGVVAPADLFESMQAKDGRVEVAREAGGLTIVAAWMVVLLVLSSRAERAEGAKTA